MKNVLKAKLMVLVLILGSIEFVYSGCCQSCKGNKGKNDQSKSNGNPGDQGNPGGSKEDKKQAISKFLNTKTGNRAGTTSKFVVDIDENGNFSIEYGTFRGIICEDRVDANSIGDSVITIGVIHPRSGCFIFINIDEIDESTLGNFVAALGKLGTEFRNGDEYLAVEDANKVCNDGDTVYINLNNGVICVCDDGYIANSNKEGDKYIYTNAPYYKSGSYYVWGVHGYVLWNEAEQGCKAVDVFRLGNYDAEDIKKFKFKLRII